MSQATISAKEFAELLSISTWTVYKAVRDGSCPVAPIRIGRRLVWSTAKVAKLLGVDPLQSLDLYSI